MDLANSILFCLNSHLLQWKFTFPKHRGWGHLHVVAMVTQCLRLACSNGLFICAALKPIPAERSGCFSKRRALQSCSGFQWLMALELLTFTASEWIYCWPWHGPTNTSLKWTGCHADVAQTKRGSQCYVGLWRQFTCFLRAGRPTDLRIRLSWYVV